MKDIKEFICEKLNDEITELRNLVKKFDRSKLFDNNYKLDDSLPTEFYNKLVELSYSKHPSNETLISIWKMIFSKTSIEPMVGEIIGKECTYSTIEQDRKEKWDIKYNNILIDVKNTLSSKSHNYSLSLDDIDFIKSKLKDGNRYILFLEEEIKTWDYFVQVYKRKNSFKLYMISYNDLNDLIENNDYEIKKSGKKEYILIPENDIKKNDKVRKNIKL
jgi:hypothetical protein